MFSAKYDTIIYICNGWKNEVQFPISNQNRIEKYGEEKESVFFKEGTLYSHNLQLLTTQNFPFHQGPICNMLGMWGGGGELLGMGGKLWTRSSDCALHKSGWTVQQ